MERYVSGIIGTAIVTVFVVLVVVPLLPFGLWTLGVVPFVSPLANEVVDNVLFES